MIPFTFFTFLFAHAAAYVKYLFSLGNQETRSSREVFHVLSTNYIALFIISISIFGYLNGGVMAFRYLLLIGMLSLVLWLNKQGCLRWSRHLLLLSILSLIFVYPIIVGKISISHFLWYPYGLILLSLIPFVIFDWKKDLLDLFFWIGLLFFAVLFIDIWMLQSIDTDIERSLEPILDIKNKITQVIIWFGMNSIVFVLRQVMNQKEKRLYQLNEEINRKMELVLSQSERIVHQNEELIQGQEQISDQRDVIAAQKEEMEFRNDQLAKFNKALLRFNKDQVIQLGDWDKALKYITKQASELGNVSRVGIWKFEDDLKSLACLIVYQADKQEFFQENTLYEAVAPRYFQEVRNENIIVADDAIHHPTLQDFRESYLIPCQIKSMLDVPFFLEGKLSGVVCLEQQHEAVHWSNEMINFAQSIADIITITYKANLLRLERQKIVEQSLAIELQNEVLKDKQAEIEEINADLEQRVSSRTRDLELQNGKLAEYAFINAHLLRGPLCRVKGLASLLGMDEMQSELRELLKKMQDSVNELDEVVLRINQTLEEEDNLDEADLVRLRDKIRKKVGIREDYNS